MAAQAGIQSVKSIVQPGRPRLRFSLVFRLSAQGLSAKCLPPLDTPARIWYIAPMILADSHLRAEGVRRPWMFSASLNIPALVMCGLIVTGALGMGCTSLGPPPAADGQPGEYAVIDTFHFLPEPDANAALASIAEEVEAWKERYKQEHNLEYASWWRDVDGATIAPLWGGRTVFAAPPPHYRVRGEAEVIHQNYGDYGANIPLTIWRWTNGRWSAFDVAVPGGPDRGGSTSDFLVCVDTSDHQTVTAVLDLRTAEPSPLQGVEGLYDLSISPAGTWIGYRDGNRVGGAIDGGELKQWFAVEPIGNPWPAAYPNRHLAAAWIADGQAVICADDTLVELSTGSQRPLGAQFGRLLLDQRPLTDQVLAWRDGEDLLHRFGPDLQIVETLHLKLPKDGDRITSISPTTEHFAIHTTSRMDFLPGSWGRTAVCRRNGEALRVVACCESGMTPVVGWMTGLQDPDQREID